MAEAPAAECTAAHRCGQCPRDTQVTAQARIRAARLAEKSLPAGQRQCSQCTEVKPIREFGSLRLDTFKTYCCDACEIEKRLASNVRRAALGYGKKNRVGYKCINGCGKKVSHQNRRCRACFISVRTPRVVDELQKPTSYKRYNCIEECGNQVGKAKQRCRTCMRAHQMQVAASAEAKIRARRIETTLNAKQNAGMIIIGEEPFALLYRCTKCQKGIIAPSKCYTCSTGKPITLAILPYFERKPVSVKLPESIVV